MMIKVSTNKENVKKIIKQFWKFPEGTIKLRD